MTKLLKTVALVGMMGAGKTSIGKRLAAKLAVPFKDADHEIEAAAKLTVAEIFARFGEPYFRDGERRVITRLLGDPPHVLATGGGAYMDPATRAAMKQSAFTIWLNPPIDILLGRVKKRDTRPLLNNTDMRGTLETLLAARGPTYSEADMILDSADELHAVILDKIVAALTAHGICEEP